MEVTLCKQFSASLSGCCSVRGAPIQLGTVHLSGTAALGPCQSTLGNTTGALWSQHVIVPSAGHLFALGSD